MFERIQWIVRLWTVSGNDFKKLLEASDFESDVKVSQFRGAIANTTCRFTDMPELLLVSTLYYNLGKVFHR